MARDKVSAEILSVMDEIFPGLQKLVESKRMDKGWQMTRKQEQERRLLLQRQAYEIQRLRLEAAGQLTLPIFGDGAAKKLAQSEIGSIALKGMEVRRG